MPGRKEEREEGKLTDEQDAWRKQESMSWDQKRESGREGKEVGIAAVRPPRTRCHDMRPSLLPSSLSPFPRSKADRSGSGWIWIWVARRAAQTDRPHFLRRAENATLRGRSSHTYFAKVIATLAGTTLKSIPHPVHVVHTGYWTSTL